MDGYRRVAWIDRFVRGRSPAGCSQREIEDIERTCRVTLDVDYKYFLLRAGRGLDGFLVGTDWTYRWLLDMQNDARELFTANDAGDFPAGAFAVAMHQGYTFVYFHSGRVYSFDDQSQLPKERYSTFREFCEDIDR